MQPQLLHIRPFRLATDIPSLLRLMEQIEHVDQLEQEISESALLAEIDWMGHDPQTDRWVSYIAEDEGKLVGHAWTFTQTPVRSFLHVAVHPAYRRLGIGSALMDSILRRLQTVSARQAVSVVEIGNTAADAFLVKLGFEIAGYNRELSADAAVSLPQPRWPAGYRALPLSQFRNIAYFVEAANACYTTMWGHAQNSRPSTVERLEQSMAEYPHYFNPDGMFVVFDDQDNICGLCSCNLESGAEPDHATKVIDSPAIVPALQSLDLLRPLVLTCMHWLNTLSDGSFRLETWGDSETAVSVYHDLGFTPLPHGLEAEYLLELDYNHHKGTKIQKD